MRKYSSKDILNSIIGSGFVLFVSLIVYLAAFNYEKSYLIAFGINPESAAAILEIKLITYVSLFTVFLTVGALFTPLVIVGHKYKKFSKFIRSQKAALMICGLILLLVLVRLFLINSLHFSNEDLLIIVLNVTLPVLVILYAIYYVTDSINIKDIVFISKSSAPLLLKTCLMWLAIYIVFVGFGWITDSFGSIKASLDYPSLPTISYKDKTYKVIRDYGDKILVKNIIDKDNKNSDIKILYTSDIDYITVKK